MNIELKKEFYGYVSTKEWVSLPDGGLYKGYVGMVSLHEAKNLVGFTPKGSEANWVALIKGAEGNVHGVLGCQIRTMGEWKGDITPTTFYQVK